jgi:hypothetical protein
MEEPGVSQTSAFWVWEILLLESKRLGLFWAADVGRRWSKGIDGKECRE